MTDQENIVYVRNVEYVSPEGTYPERIMSASILWRGRLYAGVRHGFLIQQIVEDYVVDVESCVDADGKRVYITLDQQGFLMDDGRHVMRKAARHIAMKNGQIPKDFGDKTLLSEHLW